MLRTAVHEARDRGSLVTLLYVDLDRFKPVNDDYGHEIGDALLAAVGERLRACTRARDVVARLGGDEFAVLVTANVGDNLERVQARIGEAFIQPFVLDGRRVCLGASVGRAVYPHDADDADALLRHADAAMFESKRARPDGDLLRLPGAAA
jgi:diguanylate cyclase (GGDEF)-like protein